MSEKIVVFTGAGMSAESGIGTFRDSGGLWEQYRIEEVATPEAFEKQPELVLDFYNIRRKQIGEVEPNEAHKAIAQLEKEYEVSVITQNIDDLQERAGSTNVLHLHGRITQARDVNDDQSIYDIGYKEIKLGDRSPRGGQLRSHIVWFGEAVPAMADAYELVSSAEIMVVIGTSLNVYPAADLAYRTSQNCSGYVIDPALERSLIPQGFELIKEEAVLGVNKLVQLLRRG